ncbi:MAG: alpha/beta hydrolase [Pseudomonadota bacterium]
MTVPPVNTPEAHPGLPLLALLPGLDGTGRLFAPLQAALAASEQAVTVTYPEDIPLDEPALLAWVGARLPRREPFLLVAESFSGPVAMAVAASAPPNLLGLVLVATFAEPPRRPPRWCVRLLLPWLFRLPPPAFALRWLLLGPGAPQGLVRGLRDALRAVAPAVLAHRVRQVLATDALAALAAVKVPVLYLEGGKDRLVPARCAQRIAAHLPGLERASIAAPHLLLQRTPKAALARIRAWWRAHSDRARPRPGG